MIDTNDIDMPEEIYTIRRGNLEKRQLKNLKDVKYAKNVGNIGFMGGLGEGE